MVVMYGNCKRWMCLIDTATCVISYDDDSTWVTIHLRDVSIVYKCKLHFMNSERVIYEC